MHLYECAYGSYTNPVVFYMQGVPPDVLNNSLPFSTSLITDQSVQNLAVNRLVIFALLSSWIYFKSNSLAIKCHKIQSVKEMRRTPFGDSLLDFLLEQYGGKETMAEINHICGHHPIIIRHSLQRALNIFPACTPPSPIHHMVGDWVAWKSVMIMNDN